MKTWRIYRDGSMTLPQRIDAALVCHLRLHGVLPAAVVVHPKDLDAATAALAALAVALPVVGNGGVSTLECWLQVAEVKQ